MATNVNIEQPIVGIDKSQKYDAEEMFIIEIL